MWILIILGVLFLLFGIGVMIADLEGPWFSAYVLSAILFLGAWIVRGTDVQEQYQKVCHESNYLVSPKVVHLSDNSGKLLKYISGNSEQTIAIKNTEGNFFVPESLLFVDTCNNELKIKK